MGGKEEIGGGGGAGVGRIHAEFSLVPTPRTNEGRDRFGRRYCESADREAKFDDPLKFFCRSGADVGSDLALFFPPKTAKAIIFTRGRRLCGCSNVLASKCMDPDFDDSLVAREALASRDLKTLKRRSCIYKNMS
jgi:hypothetical protein